MKMKKRTIKKAHKPSKLDPDKVKQAVRKVGVKLDWKRATKDETHCADRRTWESRCGLFRVQESVSKFSGLGTTYYALKRDGDCWVIISRHRKRAPAEKSCEKYGR